MWVGVTVPKIPRLEEVKFFEPLFFSALCKNVGLIFNFYILVA